MMHLRKITLQRADAFTDFMNAMWRAWQDFRYDKNREITF